MKRNILSCIGLGVLGALAFTACAKEAPDELYIESTSNVFTLEKKSDTSYSIEFSVNTSKSTLAKHNQSDISYYIVGSNDAEAVMVKNKFKAVKEGTVEVGAKIGDLESSNKITINVKYSDNYVAKSEDEIVKNLEEVSKKTIDFGSTINLGIPEDLAAKYSLVGCDDYMFINDKGELEVCGIILSTQVKLHSDLTDKDIWAGYLSSTFGSILATAVRNELINENVISSSDRKISKTQLQRVKKLSLDGLIVNDVTSINGIKWLTNLEELDLSNNGIDNIDFASSASNLKKIILKNNNISDITTLKNHMGLEYIDLSDNNLTEIGYLQNYGNVKYLDLSNNNISDITSVGNLTLLESVFLNNNKLTVFKDALASLYNLKELGLGNCGLTFTQINSISFVNKSNITYLDLSGTSVNLNSVTQFTNLKSLILENANLNNGADISELNKLKSLTYLDISNNDLNTSDLCVQNNGVLSFKLDASELRNLSTLCLGGNSFSDLPDISKFVYLDTLDLTNSYNLTSLNSLGKLNIKELILDECNSINITSDNGTSYLNSISKNNLPNLQKISIVAGLNYMTSDLYNSISSRVQNGDFSLRFINDDYIDKNTISNYSKSIYFTMDEFIKNSTEIIDGKSYIKSNTQEVILSLVNDRTSTAKSHYYFYIPTNISKVSIYGNEYDKYNIGFNIPDRKQSSVTFDFSSFNNQYTGNESFIFADKGSKLNVNTYLNCTFTSNSNKVVIDAWDIKINVKSGEAKIIGRNGSQGREGDANSGNYLSDGGNGENGAYGVIGNIVRIEGKIEIIAGDGGAGGNGHANANKADGGNGGNGGTAVGYYTSFECSSSVTLKAGKGGNSGSGQSFVFVSGKDGSHGNDGQKTEKIER